MNHLKRKPKDDLRADEIKFIQLLAETDNIKNSAAVAFPHLADPQRKAHRLLEHPKAIDLLNQRREHIARQLEEKFKIESTNLLAKLLKQADGQLPTKIIEKDGDNDKGGYSETQKHFDSLGAITRVMEIAGRIGQKIEVSQSTEVNSVEQVIEVSID